MDGNFSMAPPHFLQLYVIHVPLGDSTVPAVYAFLERKTESTYQELFEAISDRCGEFGADLEPSTVIIDFELAVKRALLTTFGLNTDVRFCFYHLTQSTWRKIQELRGVGHLVRL